MKYPITRALGARTLMAAAIATLPLFAAAEATLSTGAGPNNATARLDFQITVPRILFFAVGTGAGGVVANTTIDLVTFTPTPAQLLGAATNIAAATNGTLAARLVANAGTVSVSGATTGALTTGTAGETISWAQIAPTSSNTFVNPALVDGTAGAATSYGSAAARVTNLSANWTWAFNAPAAVPAAGTYGGVNLNGGRVTYTAAMP